MFYIFFKYILYRSMFKNYYLYNSITMYQRNAFLIASAVHVYVHIT